VLGAAGTVVYNFQEDPSSKESHFPRQPVSLPPSELSHEFLVRQASTISAEKAAQTLTFVVTAVYDCAMQYLQTLAELANLYEDSVLALTEEGGQRVAALQAQAETEGKRLRDLELLFTFIRKLLDANAEVCFLTGAEFASTQVIHRLRFASQTDAFPPAQASERIRAAETTVHTLFNRTKLMELDLARAKQSHIEKCGRVAADVLDANEKK